MSFLLSLFFAVLIASTMGLPQSWVFFAFRFYHRSFTEWAPAVLGLFHAEVVSVQTQLLLLPYPVSIHFFLFRHHDVYTPGEEN